MNPYEVLGVSVDAQEKAIKLAYRKLSTEHHPDKSTGDRQRFELIKLAYDVLIDPERRARYDKTGRVDETPITPQRVQLYIEATMRLVIESKRDDGTSDDPVWENIRDKIILSIMAARVPLKNERFEIQRKLERCVRMQERFKAMAGFDPVGEALKKERTRLEQEFNFNQDALELSIEAERVMKTYRYDVGPGSEGHINPGPTGRRLLSGSSKPHFPG